MSFFSQLEDKLQLANLNQDRVPLQSKYSVSWLHIYKSGRTPLDQSGTAGSLSSAEVSTFASIYPFSPSSLTSVYQWEPMGTQCSHDCHQDKPSGILVLSICQQPKITQTTKLFIINVRSNEFGPLNSPYNAPPLRVPHRIT